MSTKDVNRGCHKAKEKKETLRLQSALLGAGVEDERNEKLLIIAAIHVIAGAVFVLEQLARVSRVSAGAVDASAHSNGLVSVQGAALIVTIAESVGSCAGDHAGNRDAHAVHTDVVVGRLQGWHVRAGAVGSLSEGPCAETRACTGGVAHPREGERLMLGCRRAYVAVRATLHAAEALYIDVRGGQDEVDCGGVEGQLLRGNSVRDEQLRVRLL